jgi:hypothetical protein
VKYTDWRVFLPTHDSIKRCGTGQRGGRRRGRGEGGGGWGEGVTAGGLRRRFADCCAVYIHTYINTLYPLTVYTVRSA